MYRHPGCDRFILGHMLFDARIVSGKKKEGKTFSIEYIGKRMNKFHLFHKFHISRMRNLAWSSRLLSLLGGRDLLEMSILVFNKFILFRYLVGKVGGSWSFRPNVEDEHRTESKSGSALPAERDENLSLGIRSTSSSPGWEATAEKEERGKKERLMTSEHSLFTLRRWKIFCRVQSIRV